jgi:hypothetical protein
VRIGVQLDRPDALWVKPELVTVVIACAATLTRGAGGPTGDATPRGAYARSALRPAPATSAARDRI